MKEPLAKQLLSKSGFTTMQADALSTLLAETATKQDIEEAQRSVTLKLDGLTLKLDALETRLRAEIVRATSEVRADLSQSIAQTRTDLTDSIAQTRTDLTYSIAQTRTDLTQAIAEAQTQMMRWGIAMIIAMSSIFTLLDLFID